MSRSIYRLVASKIISTNFFINHLNLSEIANIEHLREFNINNDVINVITSLCKLYNDYPYNDISINKFIYNHIYDKERLIDLIVNNINCNDIVSIDL